MINTTTILTQPEVSVNFFYVFSVLSMGFIFGAAMFEYTLRSLRGKDEDEDEEEQDDSSDEVLEEYTTKYLEEYKALKKRDLSNEELNALGSKMVTEKLPDEKVIVIMSYDKNTESFWYYTDHLKDVSYEILETIARKFAIEYDCKSICANADEVAADEVANEVASEAEANANAVDADEVANASASEVAASEAAAQAAPAELPLLKSSVFATFKKYNTGLKGASSNFSPPSNIIEQSNHFRFRGKICDYEREKIEKEYILSSLDYATYKNLIELQNKKLL